MAARLARAKATVVYDQDGTEVEHKSVSVVVRANVATVRAGSEVVTTREGVTGIAPAGRHAWTLTFEDQPSWLVTDERRPCCGRRS